MAEELSPESKLYIKEEIEKVRKEVKEDLKEARTKATKTFSTVAIVVGLIAGFGAYFSMESAVQTKLGEAGMTELIQQAIDANNYIKEVKTNVQKNLPMLMQLKLDISEPSKAAKNLSSLLKMTNFDQRLVDIENHKHQIFIDSTQQKETGHVPKNTHVSIPDGHVITKVYHDNEGWIFYSYPISIK